MLLVGADCSELLLFQHLHQSLLQCFPDHNLKNWLHLTRKITKTSAKSGSACCTSKSKSNRSPSTCVSLSTPCFFGMNSGDAGLRGGGGVQVRSRDAHAADTNAAHLSIIWSVWVAKLSSSGLSLISSRYVSVWMSMWRRPSTASGVRGAGLVSLVRRCAGGGEEDEG